MRGSITIVLLPIEPPTTPLHKACKQGNEDEITRWIRKRPDMMLRMDEHGHIPLRYCDAHPDRVARILLQAGSPLLPGQLYDNRVDDWSRVVYGLRIDTTDTHVRVVSDSLLYA